MSRITQYAIRNTDTLIGLLLFLAGLYAYTSTLAPTVIEGDAALFQYTPYVLGVTYPTGFPLYILLGKLWVTIFPFGEIAWRMNLFSTLCSAAALPLIYHAVRRFFALGQKEKPGGSERWAALLTVLTFATIPTFWRWSTEAKTYGLNILLFGGMLYTLARALEIRQHSFENNFPTGGQPSAPTNIPSGWFGRYPLVWPTLLLGLFVSVHNTAVLLIPGFLAMVWLYFRPYLSRAKSVILHLLLLAAPGLFYLYIPIRAEWLIVRYSRVEAIERGLLADFYHSGLDGLIRYYTGVGFTEGVVANWGLVPQQFFTVYVPLLTEDMTILGVGLGIIGGLTLALRQPRLFTPLFLMYAVPIPFVIVYGQGEQSAFLLPSFLVFSIFVGNTLMLVEQLLVQLPTSRFTFYVLRFIPPSILIILIPLLFLPQIHRNVTWLTLKWNRDIYNEWADALSHPLEPGAGMLAHWGDLTSFWYMQHAEGYRPDLYGVYPPTEETVIDWYKRGNSDLYIAGPLQGWAAGIEERYQLIPWGRLVRIAPRKIDSRSLLPDLRQPAEATFGDKLRLLGVDYSPQAVAGYDYPITLAWQTLAELPPETTVSLRLSQEGQIAAQLDDRLRSGWFPSENLPADQPVLSYAQVPIPLGTLPGQYHLQLVTYTNEHYPPWTLPDGTVVLDIGSVEIVPPPIGGRPDTHEFKPLPSHDFNGELELIGYNYSVTRVGQGKGFAIKLLWQTHKAPTDNYTLLVEGLDANGNILRSLEYNPVEGRRPTGSWQPGQYIRDQVDFIVPASAPPGQEALQMRLSWLRPDGSKLKLRRWGLLPIGDGLNLGWLDVTEKENRIFELPQVQHRIDANLENKVRLWGYNTALQESDGSEAVFQPPLSTCATAEACKIDLDFYWQGVSEMDLPYQVFLHVVDTQGQIVAQHDRAPGDRGKQPTTGWLPQEVVLDPIELALPSDIAAGKYTIQVGMYLPPDGPRLSILNESGEAVSDFVEVGTLEIMEP